jgi:hypothetical protein
MRNSGMIAAGLLAAALAGPARAEHPPDPFAQIEALLGSGVLVQGLVRDEDVTLLFSHLRAALLAASQGREAPAAPEALDRRAEEIAGEVKNRGTAVSLLLLTALENAAREALRETAPVDPRTSPGAR